MFKNEIIKKINSSIKNNYKNDNHWDEQYGNYFTDHGSLQRKIKEIIKFFLQPFTNNKIKQSSRTKLNIFLNKYENDYNRLFEKIDEKSKNIVIELIAYKILGSEKVKLSTNNEEIWKKLELVKELENKNDSIAHKNRKDITLNRFNLSKIGYDIDFYYLANGVMIDFISEQFALRRKEPSVVIEAGAGDVVLECGACWGASALYFAEKVKEAGQVHSFEFVSENLRLYKKNMKLNSKKKNNITLVPLAVHSTSEKTIYFNDLGPGSTFSFSPFDGYTEETKTISIDDYVENNNITKVDFISMDVEGSEQEALKGAIKTIKKFKPKLAISIYHSDDDFVQIPNWIINQNLGYKIHINHYTIYAHETVCFASVV